MPLDEETIQALIRQLAEDRNAYVESVNRTQNLLVDALYQAGGLQETHLTSEAVRRHTRTPSLDVESVFRSMHTGADESETEDNESLFVQEPLKPDSYDEEGLRLHLHEFSFPDPTRQCLRGVLGNQKLFARKASLFPETKEESEQDDSLYTHYSIFDVGTDGAPVPVKFAGDDPATRKPQAIWKKIKDVNTDPSRKQAVGRIVIVREPSPLLFGAIHYVMHKHFDVDELYEFLVDDGPKLVHPHRAFAVDRRHRRAFHWTFEYFTIIGDGRKPMTWQLADTDAALAEATHVPISRCSSFVALSLEGDPINQVKNRDRNVKEKLGDVFDPFAPWRVLSVQCYPDWKSNTNSHDSTKHYVNGPEAFMVTLKAEYKDARKRLREVYEAISDLVEPPTDFMFHQRTRDAMLFEDSNFTYSRRYHWAYHSLGIMNRDITEMVMAYRDTFKENVWDGRNKIIWPGDSTQSSRYSHWRKRMADLRAEFDHEVEGLEAIRVLNKEKMKEIVGLRENLFSGTSVQEARKSVDSAMITVAQGQNIKLLTLVTIFFLPLTFVTSVFGMTNMPQTDNFDRFAWATVAICIPTYVLIGTLNTKKGLESWSRWTGRTYAVMGRALVTPLRLFGYTPNWARPYYEEAGTPDEKTPLQSPGRRSRRPGELSAVEGLAARATFKDDRWALPSNNTFETSQDDPTPPASPKPRSSSKGLLDRMESWRGPPTRSSTIKFSTRSGTSSRNSIPRSIPDSTSVLRSVPGLNGSASPPTVPSMPEEVGGAELQDLEKGTMEEDEQRDTASSKRFIGIRMARHLTR